MAETLPRAFVCGHPIAHSRSPMIHGYWLQHYGIEGAYERLDVPPEAFGAFLRDLPGSVYVGGNVTIPHKESTCRSVDHLDDAATRIGAVNTLWMEGGLLHGGNTDAYGFAANLDAETPGWSQSGVATILGAGGAARAIVHALQERAFRQIRIVNRTSSRAQALAAHFGGAASAHAWDALPELLTETGLLVNTTSLGMDGGPGPELDLSPLPSTVIVSDIVYAPLLTPLLAMARDRGLRTVDGLGMLLHQAVPGFEKWFGRRPEVTPELRALIIADLELHQ
ncbi:shikimate dehydrogenase [Nitratireductor luteus]|uniref:shikimate dehydrogenase n=1 Tax=Nitratireductor luteus TaxID=2976980 RepID=UPI0022402117|nr:shikimate dehydrogenase [Nitratireductor luteus]